MTGFLHRTGASAAALLLFCLVLLASGCGSYLNVETAADVKSSGLGNKKGIIFASLVEQDAPISYNIIRFRYRNVTTGRTGSLSIAPGLPGSATEAFGANVRGKIEAATLPAGLYEFYNFLLVEGRSRWKAEEDFSIPFEVFAGRAAYLGQIRLIPKVERSYLGLSKAAGGRFVMSAPRERDTRLFHRYYPNFSDTEVVVIPIIAGDVPPNIVSFTRR